MYKVVTVTLHAVTCDRVWISEMGKINVPQTRKLYLSELFKCHTTLTV